MLVHELLHILKIQRTIYVIKFCWGRKEKGQLRRSRGSNVNGKERKEEAKRVECGNFYYRTV